MDDKYRLLEERIEKLEQEVQELKLRRKKPRPTEDSISQTTVIKDSKEKLVNVAKPVAAPTKPTAPKPVATKPVVSKPLPQNKLRQEVDLEKVLIQWMPRVFMVILLIGLLWGLKIGMDNGWITYSVRVVLGYGGTAFLGWFGYRQYNLKRHALGLSLLGGMVALGMLTTFAAHYLYDFFGIWIAFALNLVCVLAGIVLSQKLKSETLATFSAFGAFLIPFLLEDAAPNTLLFAIYVSALFLSLFYISLRSGHKYTFYVIFGLFHITLFSYYLLNLQESNEVIITSTILIQHLFLLGLYFKKKVSHHVFSEILLYTNFVFGVSWMKMLDNIYEPYVYGGLAIIYVLLSFASYKEKETSMQSILSAISVFAVGLFVLSFNFDEPKVYSLLFLLNGAVGLWVALQFKSIRTMITSGFIYFFSGASIVLLNPIDKLISMENLLWLSLLASVVFLYKVCYKYLPKHYNLSIKYLDMSLICGQVLSLIYVFMLVYNLVDLLSLGDTFSVHLFLISVLTIIIGFYKLYTWKHGKYISYAAIVQMLLFIPVFMFAELNTWSSNLTAFDFGSSLFIEISFVAILIYFLHAIWNKKFYLATNALKDKFHILAIVMQVILFIFINKWTFAVTDFVDINSDFVYLIHSLILLVFAFASISIGKVFSWKWVRILGAILIAATIVKLFFIDLIQVAIVVRAILFIIVGVIGIWYSKTLYKK